MTDSAITFQTVRPARITLFVLSVLLGVIMAQPETIGHGFMAKTLAQEQAFLDSTDNLLFDGPWYTGKTRVVAAKAYLLGDYYHNNCIALVRKKRVDLKITLWREFVKEIIEPLPSGYIIDSNKSELYYKLYNGTEFFGAGLDSTGDVNKLASRQYGFVGVEEATEITEEDFDEKIGRCMRLPSVPFHQVMCITNPSHPAHFLNKRFILEDWDRYNRIQGTLLPNVTESYLARLDMLTGVRRLRYRDGLWVAQEGAVYPYDPSKHLINMADLERYEGWQSWDRIIGVDFGVDHPFCALFFAKSPSDDWYMYKEIYMTGRSPTVNAKQLRAEIDKEGIADRVRIYSDHEAGAFLTFQEAGLYMTKAVKDRLAGQGSVYRLFEEGRIFFIRGALLEVDQGQVLRGLPTKTVDEFPHYVWKEGGKEDMVKVKDDGMDTMRYAVHSHRWCY